ncbi:Phospholipase D1 [Lecanosticta acicola]|uniref:Phospholipase D1 n=1 Tax=Lecanosticta acicola TaxID=111012 RepID=A0AAI9E9P7_9PEZI|nr:Phospholipase D1 [Lecanosticta acicola]
MSTAALSREDEAAAVSPGSGDVSPTTVTRDDGKMQKDNGFVSSPLRTEQRRSTVLDKELPDVPQHEPGAEKKLVLPPTLQFPPPSSAAFPFSASPGSVGPSPTTAEAVANGFSVNGTLEPSPSGIDRRRPPALGTSTPPERRRSVQFVRGTNEEEGRPNHLAKTTTWETDEDADEQAQRDRQGSHSFMKKLRAFASSNHVRTASSATVPTGFSTPNAALSPQSERSEPLYPIPSEDVEAGTEADEEDLSGNEDIREGGRKKRRKSRRPPVGGSESLPSTPKTSRFTSFMRDHPIPGTSSSRPAPSRRATLSDVSDSGMFGVSEDEGRDKIRNAWRRGIEGARGLSYTARKEREGETSEHRRPGNLRRITGLGDSSPFRQRADRYNSASAQKWRQVKAGLKMIGQRKKDERMRIDHQKSAQLMAELIAGAPAALIFASMFQRDDKSRPKVPVLLDQLKISIPSVHSRTDKTGDRDYIYRVDLEYGNGPARMNWTIHRSVFDFVNLHAKYKSGEYRDKVKHLGAEDKSKAKIPRFPKSVIPYARGMRGLFDKLQDEDDEPAMNEALAAAASSGTLESATAANTAANSSSAPGHKRKISAFAPPRRQSTSEIGNNSADPDALTARQREIYADRSRQKLEVYLQQMIRWLIFRPESTRLCKFLELSAMAIRLSAEGGYQGKQGLLRIASRRQKGPIELHRKTLHQMWPSAIKDRTRPRWFLVRHSYLVCVDGPESLNPYDVFLVDSDFVVGKPKKKIRDQKSAQQMAKIATENATPTKKAHIVQLYNSERSLKLAARNEKQLQQFEESIHHMMTNTVWAQKQRFGSFAPIRNNVWARWLVDGRDHMWQVSRAIDNAKDFVYIHDWWLSPELYMRRPAAISQKWRLDRLLQRKASQGVKIFVVVYRNIESAIPIDSEYTKWSLLDLHPNIWVQRSPNQLRQNQFFWAHHEKICVVDNMMAFVGGIDLCFGRWDDPNHTLTDDKLTGFELDQDLPRDSEHCQMWPGKDYSNPRVQDFYALDRPYEEMYDRTKVPRMPWHDISMQIVGQPARDVGRHFVQRWNYILRSRVTTRPTPVLMPPPEYDHEELEKLGMTGTCQIQILRSCSFWSIGTPNKVEHSIMNAYCALIRNSEHFVYIENQFFVTSTENDGTTIHNRIGDAIVDRAIQAHVKGQKWQICIIIPLMPGFQNSVEAADGTSVRLIMQVQFRSICRGDKSIFGRLRAAGIEPEDHVRFYSLRQWGKIGPRKCLTTEQLYIHAKCMIVDDRSVIIGSANINERSMLGSRDSEVAAVVTDSKMLPSFMGGEPYEVGEFAHTLRKRLMREHLGIDVDAIYRSEQAAAELEREAQEAEMDRIYNSNDYFTPTQEYFETPPQSPPADAIKNRLQSLDATAIGSAGRKEEVDGWAGASQTASSEDRPDREQEPDWTKGGDRELDVEGFGYDNMKGLAEAGQDGFRDTYLDPDGREVLVRKDAPDALRVQALANEEIVRQKTNSTEGRKEPAVHPPWPTERLDTVQLGLPMRSQLPELPVLDDTDIGGPPLRQGASESAKKIVDPLIRALRRPEVTKDCMTDPLADGFYRNIWNQVADNNTKIYRQVFRCMPDSEVLDWRQYHAFIDYNERFMQAQGLGTSKPQPPKGTRIASGPPGAGGTNASMPTHATFGEKANPKGMLGSLVDRLRPGSKASTAGTVHTDVNNEKDGRVRGSPATPGSGASSGPTAVPSDGPTPLEEKDNNRENAASDGRELLEQDTVPDEKETTKQENDEAAATQQDDNVVVNRTRTVQIDASSNPPEMTATQSSQGNTLQYTASQKRRRRATTKSSARPVPDDILGREEAEELLNLVQGHLVHWPYDWLEKEERGSNWLYTVDTIAPLEIYD